MFSLTFRLVLNIDAAVVSALTHVYADLICTKSIKIQPSTIGYITKSVALVSIGERHKAYQVCDIMFAHSHSSDINFLLLIKVCVLCKLGCPQIIVCLGYHHLYGWRAH